MLLHYKQTQSVSDVCHANLTCAPLFVFPVSLLIRILLKSERQKKTKVCFLLAGFPDLLAAN